MDRSARATNPEGAFGPSCKGTLLYEFQPRVLQRMCYDCLDELRELEERSEGRISVRHTLTDFEVDGKEKATG